MVFYQGRAPTGTKTKWKLNEYKALDETKAIIPYPALQVLQGHWHHGPGLFIDEPSKGDRPKKTMVFYQGRAPTGTKIKWKLNEYKALDETEAIIPYSAPQLRNEFTLCRVYKKSGCLRAFNRRPSIPATTSENPRAQEALTSDGQNHSGTKRARSEDSSSGDENGRNPTSLQGELVDLKMLEEFDWNQLDWD